MYRLLLVLVAVGLSTYAHAQSLPPTPEGGLNHYLVFDCSDNVSGQKGKCVRSRDVEGNEYLIFVQNDIIQFIRLVGEDDYETIYMRDTFNSF